MSRTPLAAVIQQHNDLLGAVSGVVGLLPGTWKGQLCVNVFIEDHVPQLLSALPSHLGGYPVVIIPVGPLNTFRGATQLGSLPPNDY